MPENITPPSTATIALTRDLVCAYVAHHHLPASDLPGLITTFHGSLSRLASGAGVPAAEEAPEPLTPAQIRRSITPGALISLLDGKPYKTLKRHLTKHGLDPASYRKQFGLPSDYPMVCPDYSATRTALAKQMMFGHRPVPGEEAAPAKSGRRAAQQTAE